MSEQVGWRGFIRAVKAEAPRYATLLPLLPRLLHQRLNETPFPYAESAVLMLLKQQQRRNTLLTIIVGILLLQTLWILLG
jgi:ubiquinone biosynthesis protein